MPNNNSRNNNFQNENAKRNTSKEEKGSKYLMNKSLLTMLMALSNYILIYPICVKLITNPPYIYVLVSSVVSIIMALVGLILSMKSHKQRVSEILKIDDPMILGKEEHLKMPFLAFAGIFASIVFVAIYVIAYLSSSSNSNHQSLH